MGDLVEFSEVEELRNSNRSLERRLRKSQTRLDELVAACYAGARDAYASLVIQPPVVTPKVDMRRKSAEVALWCMGDWQGAKLTTSYNSEVMRERVMRFAKVAEQITNIQRADHPVKDCTILFGGDMVEGLFQFPTQPFEIDATLFGQFVTVSQLLIDTVREALRIYERVQVVAEWGNHGRIGSKRSTIPKGDNFDRMCYEHARRMMAGEKRLRWEDCPEDIQRVEIGNYRALCLHSDEIGRNGFAAPSTIVNYINRLRSGAYRWDFRDAYTFHYHTHAEWPLANGEGAIYQTGSTESDNRYARDTMASSAIPSQRLHYIDPTRGRVTSQYKIWLGDGD